MHTCINRRPLPVAGPNLIPGAFPGPTYCRASPYSQAGAGPTPRPTCSRPQGYAGTPGGPREGPQRAQHIGRRALARARPGNEVGPGNKVGHGNKLGPGK